MWYDQKTRPKPWDIPCFYGGGGGATGGWNPAANYVNEEFNLANQGIYNMYNASGDMFKNLILEEAFPLFFGETGGIGINSGFQQAGTQVPGFQQEFSTMANPWQTGNFSQFGAPGEIMQQAFDPQQALYKQQLGQLEQQTGTQLAEQGLGNSPYGADVMGNVLSNFNIDWQNNLLNREISGVQGALAPFTGIIGAGAQAEQPTEAGAGVAANLANTASQAYTGNQQAQLQADQLNQQASQFGASQLSSGLSGLSGLAGIGKG